MLKKININKYLITVGYIYAMIKYLELSSCKLKEINEYLGIYKFIFILVVSGYVFSLYMKNIKKKKVLRTRLFFSVLFFITMGYFYLFISISPHIEKDLIEQCIMNLGFIDINLGYIEIYTFLSLLNIFGKNIFMLINFIIFIFSIFIIFGKVISKLITITIRLFETLKRRICNNEGDE